MENPIRKLVRAKVKTLLAKYEETKAIKHAATQGALREQAIEEFIVSVLPHKYIVKSGFICDSNSDHLSPQIDLIVAVKDEMPSFSLNDSTFIIPVELALLTFEIKSTIDNKTIEQLKRQREVVNKLRFEFIADRSLSDPVAKYRHAIGSVVISFDSRISEESLKRWFEEENNLLAICVIGQYTLLRLKEGARIISASERYDELLLLMGKLYRVLSDLSLQRSQLFTPNWDKYLQDQIPVGGGETISIDRSDSSEEAD